MLVKQLKEKLANVKDDCEVILSSDSEGNSYSPLSSIYKAFYEPDNSFSGEITDEKSNTSKNCLVLYPIH